jgi:hypothetical protein
MDPGDDDEPEMVAGTFREGAPTRVATAPKKMPADSQPQPATVGGSEVDEPDAKPAKGSLTGQLTLDGKPPTGKGVVMLWPAKVRVRAISARPRRA